LNHTFRILGNMPSGKNRIIVTRTGHRFPDPKSRFPKWRDEALKQLASQMPDDEWFPATSKCRLVVDYVPGDRIVRDVPGLLDALCHVLERAGIVKNDGLIRDCQWHEFEMDREQPLVTVTLESI
jgi:Holliday junction resolvase RusA-like endonuclease